MPTQIVLKADDVEIPATLNDTVAAKAFFKRLPFTVSGHRYAADYCCRTACGVFDPTETQSGWKNGDISLAGGWFAVLFGGEETSQSYHGMMIIAHIDEAYLPLLRDLGESVKFVVEAADSSAQGARRNGHKVTVRNAAKSISPELLNRLREAGEQI